MTAENAHSVKLEDMSDDLLTGITHNGHTMETQVWHKGRLLGACADGLPRGAWQMWLRRILRDLTPAEIAEVYSADGR